MRENAGTGATTIARPRTRDGQRRRELAQFLKAARERTKPADVGLTAGPRRRAPGLLREEVAQLAGMSPTWYVWMEQARATSPSSSTLDRLARALRLSPHERAHLFRLARPAEQQPTAVQRTLPAPYDKVLRGLFPHPAYAVNVRWDLLDWNEAATVVLGEFGEPGSQSGNVLARLFLDASWRSLFVDWDEVVRSAVQQFRAATVGLVGAEELSEFVGELGLASPTFAGLWKDSSVQLPAAWRKRLHHPKAGRIAFDYATFRVEAADGDVTFVVYTPADDACATAVRKLCRVSE